MNEEQYTKLFQRAYNRTCAVFHKKGFSPDDCQDLAQEVFLEIWRDRASSYDAHISFWNLKVGLILQRAKLGRYTSRIDALIKVRNIEDHPHLGGTTEPLSEQEEIVFRDFVSGLPDVVAADVLLLMRGFTVHERRKILRIHPSRYNLIREFLLEDPNVQEYIREYLRT